MSAVARVPLAALALLLVAACGGPARDPSPAARTDLDASVAQFRTDEGPARVTAGVTNDSARAIHVTTAAIRWAGLRFPAARLDGAAVPPGQTAVFRTTYDAAGCGRSVAGAPVLVATVDGRRTTLPLHQDDPSLFGRLHASTCARERLDEVAAVDVAGEGPVVRRGTGWVLPATLVLTRRPGATKALRLVDLGGSVLLDVTAADGAAQVLAPADRRVRVPLTFASTGRCDAHSLGQSQQTFVLSAFLRLPGEDTQRVVLALSSRQRGALQEVIDRSCGTG